MHAFAGGNQPFNPFSQRQKNTRVQWFEKDLETLYGFVASQTLLTAEQELLFGKALHMWSSMAQVRTQMKMKAAGEIANATGVPVATVEVSDAALADAVGVSLVTLQKLERFAEISKARLVNSNLKLVLAVVSRYRTAGIPNAELIAEGTRGLSKAALRYDYTKGFRFATYATWYVHQAVAEYVRWRKHPAKMPSRYIVMSRRIKDFTSTFKTKYGRQPSTHEISEGLGQSYYDVQKVQSMTQYPTLLHSTVKSSTSKSDGSKERTYDELIPSLHKAPVALADGKDLRRDMERIMQSHLNDVERDVLRLRLGLDDGRVKPVKEVGKRFAISWKQVRKTEREALSKLKVSRDIDEFVEAFNSV